MNIHYFEEGDVIIHPSPAPTFVKFVHGKRIDFKVEGKYIDKPMRFISIRGSIAYFNE